MNAHRWQKSTFSGGDDGDHCIELAAPSGERLALREGIAPHEIIETTPAVFRALLGHLKKGRE